MTSEEFQTLRATFERLIAAPESERVLLLERLDQHTPEIGAELRRMLAAHAKSSSVLDRPAVEWIGPPALSSPVREGSHIGPYNIEKQLGMGGMGVVYLARRDDGSFDRLVAIKILRRDRIDRQFFSRFQQERRILAQLDHPHIASILDAGETPEGEPYFVMEYVDGVPITDYCRVHGLTVERKLDLFLQVCDAIQHAHRNLTVHRDLKPGNVLVTEAGAVKLLDFGIAKLIEQEPDLPLEPLSAVILTPEYSSPEQIRREPVTTATDVFALGILLYELLTGEHPFRPNGRLPHEVMRAICDDDPALPSAAARQGANQLRGDLDTITLTALRKQPAWRYPSVEQLAEDIRRYRRGWPISAKGDRRWYRFQKFARRQKLPLAAAALLILSLSAGIVATTYQGRRADQARAVAEMERERAEAERANSDRQRQLAQQSQQVAEQQRRVAEVRTQEAELAQQKERQRYRDVRSLASSLLFDLYDGVRDLAGSSTARRLILAKVQRQLEVLKAEAGNDIGLQRDLAACYERMGELQVVDPRRPSKNEAAAALESYRKAVDLRRKISQGAGSRPEDRRDLALSLAKLGDGWFFAGDVKQAVESYQTGWEIAQSLIRPESQDGSMLSALGAIDERRCVVLLAAGNSSGAAQACQEGIATLTPLAGKSPDDVKVQRLIATTEASYANALRLSKQPQDAEQHARLAIESLERLEVLAPNNAEYRRLASSSETILAGSLAASGNLPASLEAFRRSVQSMEAAIEIDPNDLGSALRLSVTLLAFSRRLAASGSKDEAHDAAKEALQLLERTSQRPGAGAVEWNELADALLKVEWPDLHQWPKALQLAQNAVSATGRKNPFFLDTLAWAWFRNGSASRAVETEREALGLLPAGSKGGLQDELTRGLKTFLGETPEKL